MKEIPTPEALAKFIGRKFIWGKEADGTPHIGTVTAIRCFERADKALTQIAKLDFDDIGFSAFTVEDTITYLTGMLAIYGV